MADAKTILGESWKRLISRYISGNAVLRNEANMEKALLDDCRAVMVESHLATPLATQEYHRSRRVDLRIGPNSSCVLAQLKLYHDRADWKESPSMTNTVESDLKFAKGHGNTYVGIIDAIPSTPRAALPFKLKWKAIEIDSRVFDDNYANINPKTSPPRERRQKVLLARGSEI